MANSHSNEHALIPAVSYLRMSSDKQEASIDEQRVEVAKYAKQRGYIITREYVDEGISGDATEKRKQFQRMIADAEKKQFKAVLCWDMDRFGRFDSIEAGRWIHPLRQAGVKLDTVAQGSVDWSDFASRMIYGIQQEGKHAYLRDLSRNILRGKLATAKRGGWQGKAPYGYRVEGEKGNKRLVLGDSEQVAIVKRIFRDYLAGKSLRGIAQELNAENSNSRWIVTTLADMLRNIAYVGTYRWNARHEGKYHGVSGDSISPEVTRGANDESEWIIFENHHSAIIDLETFEKVQERLQERKKATTPHTNGGKFLFSGLIHCGKCGCSMAGKSVSGIRYSCASYNNAGTCDRNAVNQGELLDNVIQAIQEKLLNNGTLERLKNAIRRKLEASTPKVDGVKLRKELAELEAKIEKARRRLVEVDADMLAEVQHHLRGLREQRERLETSLKQAGTPRSEQRSEVEGIVDSIFAGVFRLAEAVKQGNPATVREMLRCAVERIDLWSDKEIEGKQHRYRLKRGVIHLRGFELSNLSTSLYQTQQVIKLFRIEFQAA